jgi:asparagine synthase (glutamine-hydrolysing)
LLGTSSNLGIDPYQSLWEQSAQTPLLTRLLAVNIGSYLLDDLLPKADRTSMAHGLEVRSPFLDPDLMTFAINLPSRLQVRGMSLKRVLKEAMKGLLPREILDRRKRGFGVPLDRWFRTDLRLFLEGMLGPGARIRAHLDGEAVDAMLAEHQGGGANHGHALWTLLTLEVFLRREGW